MIIEYVHVIWWSFLVVVITSVIVLTRLVFKLLLNNVVHNVGDSFT